METMFYSTQRLLPEDGDLFLILQLWKSIDLYVFFYFSVDAH